MTKFNISIEAAEQELLSALKKIDFPNPEFASHAAIWLEACDYPGLQNLQEARADTPQEFQIKRTAIGLDLQNISCALIGELLVNDILKNGRVFLRSVRHGLFLLPSSVSKNFGIGCLVDPSFAIGGERSKNPYGEKLEKAALEGINIDEDLWRELMDQT